MVETWTQFGVPTRQWSQIHMKTSLGTDKAGEASWGKAFPLCLKAWSMPGNQPILCQKECSIIQTELFLKLSDGYQDSGQGATCSGAFNQISGCVCIYLCLYVYSWHYVGLSLCTKFCFLCFRVIKDGLYNHCIVKKNRSKESLKAPNYH